MPELATLLARCRAGDELAWEALVRRFQGRVFGVAMHYLRNREDARDAAQEIFVRVYRRLDTFEGSETFVPWLLRLSRNCCIDRLRRNRVRVPPGTVGLDDGPEPVEAAAGPDESSEREDTRRLVHRAIDRMGEKNREIILLKDIHGLKLEQIAEMLGLPLGTVKSRSNRARVELARKVRALDPSYGA